MDRVDVAVNRGTTIPVIIRAVKPSDFDAIAAITNPYILRTSIHFGTALVTADELRADWEKTRDQFPYAVAVDGGIVGYAKTTTFRARPAYAWTAEIGVYVDEKHHQRGVATALYRTLVDVCRAQGFHALIGGITLPNDASVRLHEKLGFVKVGHFREIGWKFSEYHDVGFWQLSLSSSKLPARPLLPVSAAWPG